ncbi:hypothetical protein AAG570_009132 [Ranatra chinensis]|uniref:Uncharacterized protein n=1 Tax=Ranatra chinensis TaxID=642074 RepID=A0ABD0YTI5_9HEMI
MASKRRNMFYVTTEIGAAFAASNQDMRVAFDEFLPYLNYYMTINRLQEIWLPDFFRSEAPVFTGVTLANLSTIVRKGEVLYSSKGGEIGIGVNLGLKDARIHVDRGTPIRDGFTGIIGHGSVNVRLEVVHTPNGEFPCTAYWTGFNIIELDNITIQTGDMAFEGTQLSADIIKELISHYNKQLNADLLLEMAYRALDLCKIWPEPINWGTAKITEN